jgi:starch synthase
MYADHVTGKEFADNDERFIFFNRTVIETCLLLGWFPDVIHCMGWQAALVPAYIRTMYPQEFKKTRVVFTITDFNDQGAFPWKTFAKTWLPEEVAAVAKHKTKCNFTRIGMHYADRVTTLSPAYANELKANKEFKEHFTPLLHKRALLGIPHGTDMMIWTPKADPHVKPKFDAKDPSNKGAAREALQKMMGLSVDREKMVITYAGRLTEDLGADILLKAIPDLLKDGHQVIVTSDIPPADQRPFEALAKKHPKQMAFMVPLDDEGIHHVIAGSTLLLKPSRSEASGQFQRTCLLYGTIPVVRVTGGNAEGLVDADTKGGGNAYLFTKADTADLLKAVGRAVKAHADTETWSAIVATAMNTNVAWTLSAKPYDELYRAICKE